MLRDIAAIWFVYSRTILFFSHPFQIQLVLQSFEKIKKMLNKCKLQNFKTSVKKKTQKRGITLIQAIALENTLPLYASIMGTKMQWVTNGVIALVLALHLIWSSNTSTQASISIYVILHSYKQKFIYNIRHIQMYIYYISTLMLSIY